MSPAELYWAFKSVGETRTEERREAYEVARFLGILIKNPKVLHRAEEILPFSWEKGKKKAMPKKQTLEEQKAAVYAIAGAFPKKKKKFKRRNHDS